MVAGGAGALALAVSSAIFPLLSDNNDEAVYLLQAEALRNGQLFPPAPDNWRAFLPALSVYRDGHFVPKYAPVHAGLIALGDILTGSQRAGLVFAACLAAATLYLLARETLGNRRHALVAAIFFALSPLTIIQSGTFLSYLSTLGLLQGFAAALLAGSRRKSRPLLALSGLLFGVAFFSRPFDALLFSIPFGLWLIWVHRRTLGGLISVSGWVASGAALPLTAMLAYFEASTGSPFDSPFNLLEPSDAVGFGVRRMYAQSPPLNYTPGLAWIGMTRHLMLLGTWCFGGILLAGLAILAVRKMEWKHPGRWVGLVAVAIPAGYFFFWGSFGSIKWGAPFRLGPYYYLPMLTPLSILGAAGFMALWTAKRRAAIVVAVAMLALSGASLAGAASYIGPYTDVRRELYGPLLDRRLENAIVFLPRLTKTWMLTHPFAIARNDADFSGDVLWVLDRGPAANREVLAEFPDRQPLQLVLEHRWKISSEVSERRPSVHVTTELRPLANGTCAAPLSASSGDSCFFEQLEPGRPLPAPSGGHS